METTNTIKTEIAIIGAGPGGLGAAVQAGRMGKKVLLIERYGIPGGMASIGEISPFMPNSAGKEELDQGIYQEWRTRIRSYMSPASREYAHERTIHKEYAALAMEDMLLEAGVSLLYNHTLLDVKTEKTEKGIRVSSLRVLSKSGITEVKAERYIDSTGDGDLAVLAGFPYEEGGPGGHSQPMTLCFKVSRINRDKLPNRKEINRLYDKAKETGKLTCPREDVLFFETMDPSILHFNTTRVIHKRGTSGIDLSEAEIEGRRQLRDYLTFFRESVPGMENCELQSMGATIGVRESRRIMGEAFVDRDDFIRAAHYDDAVSRVHYNVDIHNPNGTGTEFLRLKEDEYYEIPYGCLIPRNSENLLMACRAISVDHAVHASMRIMPPVCTLGQAAGMAAVLSLKEGCSVKELDGVKLRKELKKVGAYL
jgi:hypothetical protein